MMGVFVVEGSVETREVTDLRLSQVEEDTSHVALQDVPLPTLSSLTTTPLSPQPISRIISPLKSSLSFLRSSPQKLASIFNPLSVWIVGTGIEVMRER
ncbi:hypothetical protein U1Q18_017306 [Sarracenia purpurea var. burkii]